MENNYSKENSQNGINYTSDYNFVLPDENRYAKQISPLSKKKAIFLALFFGIFASHDKYLGKKDTYKTKKILTYSIIGSVALAPWALYDIFQMIFNDEYLDGEGRILKWKGA